MESELEPTPLVRVEIRRELFISGTIQQIREYVATHLEAQAGGSA